LSNSFFSGGEEEGYVASKAELPGGFDPKKMGLYWSEHQGLIRQLVQSVDDRYVVMHNYTASYRKHLPGVFATLDKLADEAIAVEVESEKVVPNNS
jgi:hypothetical protein